ncbi:hypothetical protein R69619_07261 [Paraburkholderia nemoris]|nr:hypothetical protein [Paraburkholderia aspalathi]CAE6846794.1 hypothetical protein R69619_07261 [Paraburkholderia nemoris]
MPTIERRKKPAASAHKAHAVTRKHLRHGSTAPLLRTAAVSQGHISNGLTKLASTLSGGASVGLAAAVLVPGAPVIAGIAALAGLIGSGLLVKRYG